jgi:hypothetical protein
METLVQVKQGYGRSELQRLLYSLVGRLGVVWCRRMHTSSTWPIRGRYRCRTCGRSYRIAWAAGHGANDV